jgi:hypothetical protein
VVVVIRLKEDTQRIGCSRALGPRILVIPFGVRVVGASKMDSRGSRQDMLWDMLLYHEVKKMKGA